MDVHRTYDFPPRLQTGGPEALDPGKPLTLYGTPSSTACPDRALPRYTLLRAAAACCRRVRAATTGGDGRWQRQGEKVALYVVSSPFGGIGSIRTRTEHGCGLLARIVRSALYDKYPTGATPKPGKDAIVSSFFPLPCRTVSIRCSK